jgi:hypothetical protein
MYVVIFRRIGQMRHNPEMLRPTVDPGTFQQSNIAPDLIH